MTVTQPSLPTCEPVGPLAIVCRGARGIVRRQVSHCPACERRAPFLTRWDGAWYGTTSWCTVCLRRWVDGEWTPNPFERHWKRDRIAMLREMWDAAMLPDEYRRWTRLDMHRATCRWVDDDLDCPECNADPRIP